MHVKIGARDGAEPTSPLLVVTAIFMLTLGGIRLAPRKYPAPVGHSIYNNSNAQIHQKMITWPFQHWEVIAQLYLD